MDIIDPVKATFKEKIDYISHHGWYQWYHLDYWVNPRLVDGAISAVDYTGCGRCLDEAVKLTVGWQHGMRLSAFLKLKPRQKIQVLDFRVGAAIKPITENDRQIANGGSWTVYGRDWVYRYICC